MQKIISPKVTALAFGILTVSFLAAFYVVAWQEPGETPPGGNVPTPLNVSATAQTKEGDLTINGVLKTIQNMIVNLVTIKGDGSISPNLNADKLDDYNAADLMAAGGAGLGTFWVSAKCWSGWGSSYPACPTLTPQACPTKYQEVAYVAGNNTESGFLSANCVIIDKSLHVNKQGSAENLYISADVTLCGYTIASVSSSMTQWARSFGTACCAYRVCQAQ